MHRRAAAAAILAAHLMGGAAFAQTLKVGSRNFTEQFIVAELYAAALEADGFKVERRGKSSPACSVKASTASRVA